MQNWRIKLSLYLNYFVFAILLNSVGILIQKSINTYHVDEVMASSLEAFKDLSIAFVSFLVGSFYHGLGIKRNADCSYPRICGMPGDVFWQLIHLSKNFICLCGYIICHY